MSKIVGINKNSDKEQSFKDVEKKIDSYQSRHEELLSYEVDTINNLFDGSTITIQKADKVLDTFLLPSEKLKHVIENLEAIQKEIEEIERIEDFLYE
ncbi:hypothetical protein [Vagococcus fluvialis]|uniref:hypothetical protein n=1 Tax=Vagococcus fluvialis TaxID=2738 RepID=UPI003D0E214C